MADSDSLESSTRPDSRGDARAGEIIDIHAHCLPNAYRAALRSASLTTLDGGMAIPDWSAERALTLMERNGISKSILSVSSPGLTFVKAAEEISLARTLNEALAELIAAHPQHFGGFAILPASDTAACLKEIDYALDALKLDGFILQTNHHGDYPGHAGFAPILAKLNERRACVFLHPTSPLCLECISGGRPAPLLEFPFDTTRAIVDLIYSGALERAPNIRFIIAHAGGAIPYLAQRIAGFTQAMPPSPHGLSPDKVMQQLRRLHYDTALSANSLQMAALLKTAPASQILFGSDWPFSPEPLLGGALAAIRSMPELTAGERNAVLGGNARRLLGHA